MIEALEADHITVTQRKLQQQFIAGRRRMAEHALKPAAPVIESDDLSSVEPVPPSTEQPSPPQRDWLDVTSKREPLFIHDVLHAVARQWGITHGDIVSPYRQWIIPRQVAVLLARIHTSKSMPAIGRVFQRDHSTVLHSIRKLHWLELRLRSELDLRSPIEVWTKRAFELVHLPKKFFEQEDCNEK